MNEEILGLLGLTPEQIAQYRQQSAMAGLGSLGQALIQAGSPRQGPRQGTLAGIAQALPAYGAGQQASMDEVLQNLLRRKQAEQMVAEQQARQKQQTALQSLLQGRPQDVQQRVEAFPGSAESVLFPQEEAFTLSPGQARFRGAEQVAGLPDKPEPASPEFRNYQQAVAQGYAGSFVDYQKELKAAGRPQVSATATAGGDISPFMKKSQEAQATRFSDISISGDAARRSANDIRRLDDLIGKVETGGAAAFKQAAGNLGIKTEGLDDIQAAQAIINKLVPAQRPPGSGPMSDADLELFKQSLPRIINQPGANREIIRGMKEINQYLIKEGEIADMVLDGSITPAEGRKRLAALGNPVQDFFSRTQQPAVPTGVRVRRVN